jgi:hypothetical protein
MKVNDGVVMPKLYGFAWRNYSACTTTVYPVPLNMIARRLRAMWLWCGRPVQTRPHKLEAAFEIGRQHGHDQATQVTRTILEKVFDDGYGSYALVATGMLDGDADEAVRAGAMARREETVLWALGWAGVV